MFALIGKIYIYIYIHVYIYLYIYIYTYSPYITHEIWILWNDNDKVRLLLIILCCK